MIITVSALKPIAQSILANHVLVRAIKFTTYLSCQKIHSRAQILFANFLAQKIVALEQLIF